MKIDHVPIHLKSHHEEQHLLLESPCSKIEENVNSFHRFQRIRTYFFTKSPLSSSSPSSSARYFTFILWSLLAVKIHDFSWYFIPISIFIIFYKSVKGLFIASFSYLTSRDYFHSLVKRIRRFCTVRSNVFMPIPLKCVIRYLRKGDQKINHALQNSMDSLISATLILILLIFIVFGSLFLFVQVRFVY